MEIHLFLEAEEKTLTDFWNGRKQIGRARKCLEKNSKWVTNYICTA